MVVLGAYTYDASSVPIFLRESAQKEGVQVDSLLCTNGSENLLRHLSVNTTFIYRYITLLVDYSISFAIHDRQR